MFSSDWDGIYGDRRQELVFIGTNLNKEELIVSLNECLLNTIEMNNGVDEWVRFEDPFPLSPEL